ncbi:MAG: hypothetical protein JW827_03860 [Spirochaetes bacterium]|nr:hypothetical protein [Spirochaetota bacterium]
MFIPLHIIKELWVQEPKVKHSMIELDASDIHNAQIFGIDENKAITINLILTDKYMEKLKAQKVDKVSIYYDKRVASLLRQYYPKDYPVPDEMTFYEMEILFSQYKLANEHSSYDNKKFKSRHITLLQDIITVVGKSSKIIVPYNTLVTEKVVDKMKEHVKSNTAIEYLPNEKGILLIFDNSAYKHDPELLRLQYKIRKIFDDVNYTNYKAIDVNQAFNEYFFPSKKDFYKVVFMVGKTVKNDFLFKALKVFDPFAIIAWLTKEHIKTAQDILFDSILNKLSRDYKKEVIMFSKERDKKTTLTPIQIQKYRNLMTNLSKKFNLKGYVEIAFDILSKSNDFDMFQPKTHLMNILLDLRQPPHKIFSRLLNA